MTKPYVVIMDTWNPKQIFCLDRGYNRIPDDQVKGLPLRTDQILEAMVGVQATFSEIPSWAKERPETCVSMWTNYYQDHMVELNPPGMGKIISLLTEFEEAAVEYAKKGDHRPSKYQPLADAYHEAKAELLNYIGGMYDKDRET